MTKVPPVSKDSACGFAPGAEAEAYVKRFHPTAYLYGHGPECTIIEPATAQQKEKRVSGTFYIGTNWPRAQQKEAEDRLWWWAAYLLYLEHDPILAAKVAECEAKNEVRRKR